MDSPGSFSCVNPPNPCLTRCNASVTTNCNNCSTIGTCTYNNPGYTCSCPSGYSTSNGGITCTDVDECSTSTPCNLVTSTCQNLPGTYRCNCLAGYGNQINATSQCTPINECLNTSSCVDSSQCRDITPGYYCIPQILAARRGPTPAPFTLSSTMQTSPDLVALTVRKESGCTRTDWVFYGSTNQFQTAPCTVSNATTTTYVLNCNMSAGAGGNLSFSLRCCPPGPTACEVIPSNLKFSYPRPSITPNTLTYANSPDSLGVANLVASKVLTMQGVNFFPDMQVYFGSAAQPLGYSCAVETASFTNLTCTPQVGVGVNFTFTVFADSGPLGQASLPGTDLLSFVGDPPLPTQISGCDADGTGTKNCPTYGGKYLTVTARSAKGLSLVAPQFFIAGKLCIQYGPLTSNGFTCVLPPGVGSPVDMELRDGFTSWFGNTLSYASPSITRITSSQCSNLSPLELVNCTSPPITLLIEGDNFGASGAVVMVNSMTLAATHKNFISSGSYLGPYGLHKYLSVIVANVDQLVSSVGVQQLGGVYRAGLATFALSSCPPGQARNATGCAKCAAGFYAFQETCYPCNAGTIQPSNGQASCTPCAPGRIASSGQTTCSACGVGTSSNPDQTMCEGCPQGKFSTGAVNSACSDCVGGRYQPSMNSSSCLACAPGTFSTPNAVNCGECPQGRVSQRNGSAVCTSCPPGTFQEASGTSVCQDCIAGTYASISNSLQCISCNPGTYQNRTRQTKCMACTPGFFNDDDAATGCQPCSPGTYASSNGASSCVACSPGQYLNQTAGTRCNFCDVGFAQDEQGSVGCIACDYGTYSNKQGMANCLSCDPGYYQNDTQASSCYLCSPGRYSNVKLSLTCQDCQAGSFQPGHGQQTCILCSPGLYQPLDAATSCLPCPAGNASTARGSQSCAVCGAATYSLDRASVCTSCAFNQIQPDTGKSSCTQCTAGSTPNERVTKCQCQAGYYSWATPSGDLRCTACPKGSGYCNIIGKTFEEITTIPGFWRASVNATNFYRCIIPTFCVGADKCMENREGPMCGLCVPGYRSGGPGKECSECPDTPASAWGITFAIILLLVVLLLIMYYIVLRVANAQQARLIEIVEVNNQLAREKMKATTETGDEYFEDLRTQIYGADETEQQPKRRATDLPTQVKLSVADTSRRAPNFMYKVKILVGFFQIASYLPSQGDIPWPQAFADFISAFAIFNFDFIPWQTLTCASGINYFSKSVVVGMVPVIATVLLIIFFAVKSLLPDTTSLNEQMAKGQRRMVLWRQFVRLLLFTIFLLYPLVSKIALSVYNCVTIEGVSYLVADFQLLCYDSQWTTYAVIDGFFVALYPIGIPLAYFLILRHHEGQMRQPETILILGFLYEAYTDTAWYWELVDMLHKLILTSIVVFTPNEQRMAWNMGIMGLYLIALLVAVPYVRKGDDHFHLQVQTTLLSLAFVGFILRQDDPYSSDLVSSTAMIALIATLLILIVLYLLLAFVVITGRNIYKIVRRRKEQKQKQSASTSQVAKPFVPWQSELSQSSSQSSSNGPVGQNISIGGQILLSQPMQSHSS